MIISHSPIVSVVAVTTIATVIFISLGFLSRPSRAGMIWMGVFVAWMISSYVMVGGEQLDSMLLRALGGGLMLGALPLLWSGARAYREKQPDYAWIGLIALVLVPALLMMAVHFTTFYDILFRVVFCLLGVFVVLTMLELLGLGKALRTEVFPLLMMLGLYLVLAVVSVVQWAIATSSGVSVSESLSFIRVINLLGANVFVVAFLVSALLLVVHVDALRGRSSHAHFEAVAGDRLARAEAAGDPWWSLLDIRLDNPDETRAVTSPPEFRLISERFIERVRAGLPADADIEVLGPTRVIVLVPRAQGVLREMIASLLQRMSTIDLERSVPLAISASVGWAQVTCVGYDLDRLFEAAEEAAERAIEQGGDRWERVRGTS